MYDNGMHFTCYDKHIIIVREAMLFLNKNSTVQVMFLFISLFFLRGRNTTV